MCPEQTAIIRQRVRLLKKGIDLLPTRQRNAVEMRLNGMRFSEIAEQLNCPYNTAKANYRHGMLHLRKTLTDIVA
jgi:RNA polymerase sigma-70 factor (ECF subfamily)